MRILISLGLALISVSITAKAADPVCSSKKPYCQCTITSNDSSSISFGTISVPANAPIGTLLGQAQSNSVTVNCPANSGYNYGPPYNSGWYIQYYPQLSVSAAVSNTWETGYPGVGIRVVSVNYNGGTILSRAGMGIGSWSDFGPPNQTVNAFSGTFQFTYQLIKTGTTVTSGALNIGSIMNLVSHNIPANETSAVQVSMKVNNTSIVAQTCTVTTPSISVTLPTISSSTLNSVGATAGNTSFNIGFSCPTGFQVYIALVDNTNTGNTSTNLSLTSASTASGLALRLLKNGTTPIAFGSTNQWLLGPSATTSQIPLIAQYIRTRTIRAGTVQGVTTFTLNYQ